MTSHARGLDGQDLFEICPLTMGEGKNGPLGWARLCRIEAARAIHPRTKKFLLELAAHFEADAGEKVALHPDDPDLQSAVGDHIAEIAARFRR